LGAFLVGVCVSGLQAQDEGDSRSKASSGVGLGEPVPSSSAKETVLSSFSEVKKAQFQAPAIAPLPDELPAGPACDTPPSQYAAPPNRPFRLDYTYLGPAGVNNNAGGDIHMNELGVRYQFKTPVGDYFTLRATPMFDVLFLTGPSMGDPDLPPQVYKIAVDLEGSIPIGDRYSVVLGLTPGIWSDLHEIHGNDFRLPARALLAYKVNDALYVSGGLLYTANYYHALLPTFGFIWDVNDRVRAELIWPKGRVIYKLHDDIQFYGALEGGGDTWEIHQDDQTGRFQYRDLRFYVGSEISTWKRASFFVETGLAFNRRVRVSFEEDRNLGTAYFLRLGTKF
jgi:hypothetical protein